MYGTREPTRALTNGCRFQALQKAKTACAWYVEKLTREAQLEFCEANVRKPLASTVRVAKPGNGIWPEAHGGYIENLATKERMEVREENGVHVMHVQFNDETVDVVTLDSGAGCNVWPKARRAGNTSKLSPEALVKAATEGLAMVALGRDLGYEFNLRMWVDSTTAKAIVMRLGLGKVRHMEVKFLWAQEAHRRQLFEICQITGERNPADVLTR